MDRTDSLRIVKRIAAELYGREPRVEPLSRLNNLVYRLHFPEGAKVLKLVRGEDDEPIRKELLLIDLLQRHGVPAPVIEHRDPAGELVGSPFLVMDSAGDRTVADWIGRPGDQAARLFHEMGVVLARIHGIEFAASGEIRHDGIVPRDALEYLKSLHRLADWTAGQGLLEPAEASRFKLAAMPHMDGLALCHGDFHAVQCIVHNERIAGVVDWESAWAGNRGIDLAITHGYLDYYAPRALVQEFLAGYAATRELPADYDRAYLPVRMAHALGMMRVWLGHGRSASARRAAELYRGYSRQLVD